MVSNCHSVTHKFLFVPIKLVLRFFYNSTVVMNTSVRPQGTSYLVEIEFRYDLFINIEHLTLVFLEGAPVAVLAYLVPLVRYDCLKMFVCVCVCL